MVAYVRHRCTPIVCGRRVPRGQDPSTRCTMAGTTRPSPRQLSSRTAPRPPARRPGDHRRQRRTTDRTIRDANRRSHSTVSKPPECCANATSEGSAIESSKQPMSSTCSPALNVPWQARWATRPPHHRPALFRGDRSESQLAGGRSALRDAWPTSAIGVSTAKVARALALARSRLRRRGLIEALRMSRRRGIQCVFDGGDTGSAGPASG